MPKPDPARLRRAAAAAAVFDSAGRILLMRRSDNGNWALPGGVMETGERADETAVRETKEETGYDVRVTRLIGVYSDPQHTTITYPGGDTVHYVSLLFECELAGGEATLSDESLDVGWYAQGELPQPFHAGHIPRVQDAFARQVAAFYR